MTDLADAITLALADVPGVEPFPSQFADLPAWWVGGREFAHLKGSTLDLRLTKAFIRARKAEFTADARFTPRPRPSDWIEVDLCAGLDRDAAELLRLAAEANRPDAPGDVPSLASRRRLHGSRP